MPDFDIISVRLIYKVFDNWNKILEEPKRKGMVDASYFKLCLFPGLCGFSLAGVMAFVNIDTSSCDYI
jgi:hypothetical protein